MYKHFYILIINLPVDDSSLLHGYRNGGFPVGEMKEEAVEIMCFEGELHFDLPHVRYAVEQNVRAASELRGCHLDQACVF